MSSPNQYELVDFGAGRKLEKFGSVLVDRESPVAHGRKLAPEKWKGAFRYSNGEWNKDRELPDPWKLNCGLFSLLLKPTPFGHLGVFPEQFANWKWIESLPFDLTGLKAINLFAYTGGTTLALAAQGATVSHVDSAKNVVNWARNNAKVSGLGEANVRWLVEDAMKFVSREIKRGNLYDVIVADPPSFGRGSKKETWKLQRDFEELIESLAELTKERCRAIIVSCHTPEFDSKRIESLLASRFDLDAGLGEGFELKLVSRSQRQLASGSCFRWFAKG